MSFDPYSDPFPEAPTDDDIVRTPPELKILIAADCYLQAAWLQLHPDNAATDPMALQAKLGAKAPPFWVWDLRAWEPADNPLANMKRGLAFLQQAIDMVEHPNVKG